MSYMVEIYDKTITCRLKVRTTSDNLSLCEFVEKILQGSVLGSSEYGAVVEEVKVIKSEVIDIKQT